MGDRDLVSKRNEFGNTTFQMRSSWMNSQELHSYTFLVMIMCSVCTCLNCYHIFAENVISHVDCFSFD